MPPSQAVVSTSSQGDSNAVESTVASTVAERPVARSVATTTVTLNSAPVEMDEARSTVRQKDEAAARLQARVRGNYIRRGMTAVSSAMHSMAPKILPTSHAKVAKATESQLSDDEAAARLQARVRGGMVRRHLDAIGGGASKVVSATATAMSTGASMVVSGAAHVATGAVTVAASGASAVASQSVAAARSILPKGRAAVVDHEAPTPDDRWFRPKGGWPRRPAGVDEWRAPAEMMPTEQEEPRVFAGLEAEEIGELCVEVVEASGLPIADTLARSSDPYVVLVFEGWAAKSSVVPNTTSPRWSVRSARAFRFPIQKPYSALYLAVQVCGLSHALTLLRALPHVARSLTPTYSEPCQTLLRALPHLTPSLILSCPNP